MKYPQENLATNKLQFATQITNCEKKHLTKLTYKGITFFSLAIASQDNIACSGNIKGKPLWSILFQRIYTATQEKISKILTTTLITMKLTELDKKDQNYRNK